MRIALIVIIIAAIGGCAGMHEFSNYVDDVCSWYKDKKNNKWED